MTFQIITTITGFTMPDLTKLKSKASQIAALRTTRQHVSISYKEIEEDTQKNVGVITYIKYYAK